LWADQVTPFINAGPLIGLAGVAWGIAGFIQARRYHRRAEDLAQQLKRISWDDLHIAAYDLGHKIAQDGAGAGAPDRGPAVIVTPGLNGATFANLLVQEFIAKPPVYVGIRYWTKEYPDGPPKNSLGDDALLHVITHKAHVTVPRAVLKHTQGPILIVDDFVMSGEFMANFTKVLTDCGVSRDRIRSCAVVVTKVAASAGRAPDYYYKITDDADFLFPWGKARAQ
jgi:hypoxanthine phosphoribosyltransferase